MDIILFSASNENSQQHTRTAECPPFSQWYPMVLASIGWPACDLYAGPERVQPQAPVKVDLDCDERRALSFSQAGGLFVSLLPVLLPEGFICLDGESVWGFLQSHY